MISVSNDFKNQMKANVKELRAEVSDGTTTIKESDDLKEIRLKSEGGILKTVMRKVEFKFFGNHDFLDKDVTVKIGVVLPDTSIEYINYGTFKIVEQKQTKDKETTICTGYDLMHETLKKWELVENTDITYPATILELLQAIATKLSINYDFSNSFPNKTQGLDGDVFTGVINTYREALDMIAEVTGSIIYIDTDDKMKVKKIEHTTVLETIDTSILNKLKVISKWGSVYAVSMARTPQEDVIIQFPNLITNGDMEIDANWSDVGTPTTNERSTEKVYFNTYSRKVTVDAANEGIESDTFGTSQSTEYKIAFRVYAEDFDSIHLKVYAGDGTTLLVDEDFTGLELDDWNYCVKSYTDTVGGTGAKIQITSGSETSGTFYIDRVFAFSPDSTKTEVRIENNLIADSNRELWLDAVWNELYGLEFYPTRAEYNGLGYLQVGDRIKVKDLNNNEYETIVDSVDILIAGGMKEVVESKTPDKTRSDYRTAGVVGQKIKRTEIIVDKQEGEIILVNENLNSSIAQINVSIDNITSSVQSVQDQADQNSDDIEDLNSDVTTLEQRADSLELSVKGIGGTNLLKNSVGLKNNIEEWQEFDSNGNLIDSNNDATIVQDTDVTTNSESGSGLKISNQFIVQTFSTINGESYTFYCRYKSNTSFTINITGVGDITVPASSSWAVFKYTFTAGSTTTTLKITNVSSGAGAEATLTDNIVKLGDVNGWMQAPNEVYGKNYRFDKDGFQITSLDSTFKSLLDNEKLAVYDSAGGSDKIVMLVSKDSGRITNLTAQDLLVVRRYENDNKAARFIPTDTGLFLTIND